MTDEYVFNWLVLYTGYEELRQGVPRTVWSQSLAILNKCGFFNKQYDVAQI